MATELKAIKFSLQIHSRMDFRDPDVLLRCVAKQIHMLPDLAPSKFGWYEPLNKKFDARHLPALIPDSGVGDNVFWKRNGKGRVRGRWGVPWRSGVSHLGDTQSLISIFGNLDVCRQDPMVSFLKSACVESDGDLGFLDVLTNASIGDFPRGTADDGELSVVTHELRKYLPNMFWATIFGPEYVAMFGMEKLLATPAFRCEKVGPTHVYIQLSEYMTDAVNRPALVRSARNLAKEHLGLQYFYVTPLVGESNPARIAPKFGFDQPQVEARFGADPLPHYDTDEIINDDVLALAMLLTNRDTSALPHADLNNGKLDFSLNSIQNLEVPLRSVGIQLADNDTDRAKVILQVGAYLGEVIRRHSRSKLAWIDFDSAVKRSSFLQEIDPGIGIALLLVSDDGGQIFPLAKVEKFLSEGDENDLVFFARAMIT